VHESLRRGRECYEKRAWDDAFVAFGEADAHAPLAAEDLERMAWSAALTVRDDAMLAAFERAYEEYVAEGAFEPAGRCAFWSGFRLLSLGEHGRAGAWLGRAQTLVERELSDSVLRGYLQLPLAYKKLATGDTAAAASAAHAAAEIGDRHADADLSAIARCVEGRVSIRQGDLARGIALLDEAMLSTTAGASSPLVTGLVYCTVIAACNRVYALGRAREWTTALSRFCAAQPQLVSFAGTCQVHRAEILQLGGEWTEAIEAARAAGERDARGADREASANASYQQGEIHRLRGEHDAAEAAYKNASALGRDPQPGLALLRLAQGRADAAVASLRRALGGVSDPLERARLLPACVEIALAAGDVARATASCEELESLAAQFDVELLRALAQQARGSVQLAEGDVEAALVPLRQAFDAWQRVDAPYLAARLRVLLSRAFLALGDEDGAALERDAARAVFERLGAVPDLEALDAGAAGAKAAPRSGHAHGLSERELQVLRLLATGRTNRSIASELFLSEKTVDRHVSNLFGKLGVSTRAAATAFAYEHDLL